MEPVQCSQMKRKRQTGLSLYECLVESIPKVYRFKGMDTVIVSYLVSHDFERSKVDVKLNVISLKTDITNDTNLLATASGWVYMSSVHKAVRSTYSSFERKFSLQEQKYKKLCLVSSSTCLIHKMNDVICLRLGYHKIEIWDTTGNGTLLLTYPFGELGTFFHVGCQSKIVEVLPASALMGEPFCCLVYDYTGKCISRVESYKLGWIKMHKVTAKCHQHNVCLIAETYSDIKFIDVITGNLYSGSEKVPSVTQVDHKKKTILGTDGRYAILDEKDSSFICYCRQTFS